MPHQLVGIGPWSIVQGPLSTFQQSFIKCLPKIDQVCHEQSRADPKTMGLPIGSPKMRMYVTGFITIPFCCFFKRFHPFYSVGETLRKQNIYIYVLVSMIPELIINHHSSRVFPFFPIKSPWKTLLIFCWFPMKIPHGNPPRYAPGDGPLDLSGDILLESTEGGEPFQLIWGLYYPSDRI